jgi:hypothetical protein
MASGGFLALALAWFFGERNFEGGGRRHGERKERSTGLSFTAQSDVQALPRTSAAASGWDSERVWSGNDDWEPFVAADRSSRYVYQMTTRFNARLSGIFIRRSANGGRRWDPNQLIAPVPQLVGGWQWDQSCYLG